MSHHLPPSVANSHGHFSVPHIRRVRTARQHHASRPPSRAPAPRSLLPCIGLLSLFFIADSTSRLLCAKPAAPTQIDENEHDDPHVRVESHVRGYYNHRYRSSWLDYSRARGVGWVAWFTLASIKGTSSPGWEVPKGTVVLRGARHETHLGRRVRCPLLVYVCSVSWALEALRPMQGYSVPPATSTTHQLVAQPREVRGGRVTTAFSHRMTSLSWSTTREKIPGFAWLTAKK